MNIHSIFSPLKKRISASAKTSGQLTASQRQAAPEKSNVPEALGIETNSEKLVMAESGVMPRLSVSGKGSVFKLNSSRELNGGAINSLSKKSLISSIALP